MNLDIDILQFLAVFGIIAIASKTVSKIFVKLKLPQITGFLFLGILAGPYVLDMIKLEAVPKLNFINEIALSFIAFAAGTELYLGDLRSRFKSIKAMVFGQLVMTFVISSMILFFISDYIPFIKEASTEVRIAVSILIATIFVARSPASAIAIISEMRAKGKFTQTVIGVTVIIDVLVIILFAITFSTAKTLISGDDFSIISILMIFVEVLLSFGIGYLLGKLISQVLSINMNTRIKAVIILAIGYGVYVFSNFVKIYSEHYLHFEMYLEPLLISIIASFVVTNYSNFKQEFKQIIHDVEPIIYIAFFTLTGASVSLDLFVKSWFIALIFFTIRMFTMVIGSYVGGKMGGDPFKYWKFGWMPYATQAGVGLGLVTVVATAFPTWGHEFATILISVIIFNQIVGPPLFKWVLNYVGESHQRAHPHDFDGTRDAIIFGLENQSMALARQLKNHNWEVKIATRRKDLHNFQNTSVEVIKIDDFSVETFNKLNASKAEAIVAMNTDEENWEICEMAYEKFGTKDIVVRLNKHENFDKFHDLGALIVQPTTAIVSLLDQFVRSPVAASLLLGIDTNQETQDIEVFSKDIQGLALRQLHLPCDVLILSVKRRGNIMLSHGYTRLRIGDVVTVVGTPESLESVRLKLE